jgi:hypothetical protein
VRYVSLAYGTREEIEAEIRNSLAANRSQRRHREAEVALQDLLNGDHSVLLGETTYLVEE